MRVIAGRHKGRKLFTPTWSGLRPTSDKLRETLFNVLAARVSGARVLDGFAGTGAVGIEAISRGAAHVTFVDRDPRALALVARNLAHCGIESGFDVVRRPVGGDWLAQHGPYDIVVLDPPYDADPSGALAATAPLLADDGLLVLEHARRARPPDTAATLARVREIGSGDSALSFYRSVRAAVDDAVGSAGERPASQGRPATG
jgi:16S rRNA (guanine966-N2)-methyltransferase